MSRLSASWSTSSMILSVVWWINEWWQDESVSRVLSVLSLDIFNLMSDVTSQMNQKGQAMIALLWLCLTRPVGHQGQVGLLHLARGLVDHCPRSTVWGELTAKIATCRSPGPCGLIDRVGTTECSQVNWFCLKSLFSTWVRASQEIASFSAVS